MTVHSSGTMNGWPLKCSEMCQPRQPVGRTRVPAAVTGLYSSAAGTTSVATAAGRTTARTTTTARRFAVAPMGDSALTTRDRPTLRAEGDPSRTRRPIRLADQTTAHAGVSARFCR
jgi:hypothetical protein